MKYHHKIALGVLLWCFAAPGVHAQTANQPGSNEQDILNEPLPATSPEAPKADLKPYESPDAKYVQKAWEKAKTDDVTLKVTDAQNKVTKINLRVNAVTSITIPQGELIADYAFVDKDNFGLEYCKDTPGCLFIWANFAGFDTTLQIITDTGRIYPFYLRSYPVQSDVLPNVRVELKDSAAEVAKMVEDLNGNSVGPEGVPQPGSEAQAEADAHKDFAEWTRTVTFDPLKMRHDLVMNGDSDIAPVDLWRDDKFTYLYYGKDSDPKKWPAVWRVDSDGTRRRVRKRKTADNSFYVVEDTGRLELKRGDQVVCIRPAN